MDDWLLCREWMILGQEQKQGDLPVRRPLQQFRQEIAGSEAGDGYYMWGVKYIVFTAGLPVEWAIKKGVKENSKCLALATV